MPSTRVPWAELHGAEHVCLSSRCFVCRQSKQQLEEEQKQALYGLQSTGNVPDTCRADASPRAQLPLCMLRRPPPAVQLQAEGPSRTPHPQTPGKRHVATPLRLPGPCPGAGGDTLEWG